MIIITIDCVGVCKDDSVADAKQLQAIKNFLKHILNITLALFLALC